MPIYDWKCRNPDCGHETQVSRSMSEYMKGPDEPCEVCLCPDFDKFIAEWKKEQVSLVHGGIAGWHDECYTRLGRPTGKG